MGEKGKDEPHNYNNTLKRACIKRQKEVLRRLKGQMTKKERNSNGLNYSEPSFRGS